MSNTTRIEKLERLVDRLVHDEYGVSPGTLDDFIQPTRDTRGYSKVHENATAIKRLENAVYHKPVTVKEEISKQALLDQMQKMQKVIGLLLDKLDVKVKTRDDCPEVQLVDNSDLKVKNEG